MRFALCNEMFQDWPFDKVCATARRLGYTGIEIAPFTIDPDARRITQQQRAQLRRQAEAADVQIIGLHWLLAKTEGLYLTSPEADIRRRTAEYLAELARLCRDLGGRVLVFGSPMQRNLLPGISHAQAVDYAADVFTQAMPTLEACDVVLAVEPLGPAEGNFLNTAAAAVELIDKVGSPHCRLHLDCKAMSSESKPVAEIIVENAARLEHFHANDPNKLGPGMGALDFVPIFAALRRIGYGGWVSVEVFDYSPGPEEIARQSMECMQRCLKESGA